MSENPTAPSPSVSQVETDPEEQVLSDRKKEIEKMFLAQGIEYGAIIFTLVTLAILYWGWTTNLEYYITAESGLGYWLGIVGSVLMVITLLYSLRKRLKSMRDWGNMRTWFVIHMIIGVYGPVLILFHCNFSLGASQNETVAVITMLVVLISGIVGRYIHDKIRFGLYKHEAALEQLQLAKLITEDELASLHYASPELFNHILKYNDNIQLDSSGLIKCFFRMLSLNTNTHVSYLATKADLKQACKHIAVEENWTPQHYKHAFHKADRFLKAHYATIRKIASFAFFERLFSIWFFLHVPLFYMLIVVTIFHIIAVHMFSTSAI